MEEQELLKRLHGLQAQCLAVNEIRDVLDIADSIQLLINYRWGK